MLPEKLLAKDLVILQKTNALKEADLEEPKWRWLKNQYDLLPSTSVPHFQVILSIIHSVIYQNRLFFIIERDKLRVLVNENMNLPKRIRTGFRDDKYSTILKYLLEIGFTKVCEVPTGNGHYLCIYRASNEIEKFLTNVDENQLEEAKKVVQEWKKEIPKQYGNLGISNMELGSSELVNKKIENQEKERDIKKIENSEGKKELETKEIHYKNSNPPQTCPQKMEPQSPPQQSAIPKTSPLTPHVLNRLKEIEDCFTSNNKGVGFVAHSKPRGLLTRQLSALLLENQVPSTKKEFCDNYVSYFTNIDKDTAEPAFRSALIEQPHENDGEIIRTAIQKLASIDDMALARISWWLQDSIKSRDERSKSDSITIVRYLRSVPNPNAYSEYREDSILWRMGLIDYLRQSNFFESSKEAFTKFILSRLERVLTAFGPNNLEEKDKWRVIQAWLGCFDMAVTEDKPWTDPPLITPEIFKYIKSTIIEYYLLLNGGLERENLETTISTYFNQEGRLPRFSEEQFNYFMDVILSGISEHIRTKGEPDGYIIRKAEHLPEEHDFRFYKIRFYELYLAKIHQDNPITASIAKATT